MNPTRPSLEELLAQRPLAATLRLSGAQRGAASMRGSGLGLGVGDEWVELRPYEVGDERRHLDARASARAGQWQVRRFHARQRRRWQLWTDLGPHMCFGSRTMFKAKRAALVSACLAWALHDRGDEVVPWLRTSDGRLHAPRLSGEAGLLAWMQAMSTACPIAQTPAEPGGEALSHMWSNWLRGHRDETPRLLVSDFTDGFPAAWSGHLAGGSRPGSVMVVVQDPFETQPPALCYPLAGGSGTATLDLSDEAIRRDWLDRFQARNRSLAEAAAQTGARVIQVSTATDHLPVLQDLASSGGWR